MWTRPAFDERCYPYCPTHITRPKEERHLYLVPLPAKCFFAVPKHLKLLAVPLYELYENQQRYGPVIASIPMLLSRYQISYADAARPAGAGPQAAAPRQGQQGAEAAPRQGAADAAAGVAPPAPPPAAAAQAAGS